MASSIEAIQSMIVSQGSVKPNDMLFNADVDLFDYGYVDSFGIVGLIEEVSSKFGVDLSDIDFYAPDHRTIRGIASVVDARLSGKGQ